MTVPHFLEPDLPEDEDYIPWDLDNASPEGELGGEDDE